jgi:hypothetical protein
MAGSRRPFEAAAGWTSRLADVKRDWLRSLCPAVDGGPKCRGRDVTAFEVPQAVMNLLAAGVVKFEIIARTDALNNTAVENCFRKQ